MFNFLKKKNKILKILNSNWADDKKYIEISSYIQEQKYDSLSKIEKDVLHVYDLESEINNGGFSQYFSIFQGNTHMRQLDRLMK